LSNNKSKLAYVDSILIKIKYIQCKASLLNAIILPCATSMPGLGLQFVFLTLQKVKLT